MSQTLFSLSLDYPSLEKLEIEHSALLEELSSDYLYFDLLDSLLKGAAMPAFVFESIDSVEISNMQINITGKGSLKRQS